MHIVTVGVLLHTEVATKTFCSYPNVHLKKSEITCVCVRVCVCEREREREREIILLIILLIVFHSYELSPISMRDQFEESDPWTVSSFSSPCMVRVIYPDFVFCAWVTHVSLVSVLRSSTPFFLSQSLFPLESDSRQPA